jgi:cbb3-type cytochrome oxidase cytochrome c subunit
MKLGPPLNGIFDRRTRQWLVDHFADPQKFSPGSTMPPYRFNPKDLEAIMSYLQALPPPA